MSSKPSSSSGAGLGTFLGVYTPSILTILGVVLFLRTGWVVGNVGLVPALAIVVLAHAITISTALSVSAVATNMQVGAGGAYFMISRSLGLEIGGAIGVPLFLAQTFSVTLYAFGLAESLSLFWPQVPMRLTAAVTIVVVAAVAGRSTNLALKLQIPVMALIGLALASLFSGTASRASETLRLWQGTSDGEGFWLVFAVFFPAVTGLMAGVSMSGDLKDPKKSIPIGTMLAVGTGFVVYLIVPVALASAVDPEKLVADNLIWFQISAIPWLILPGLLGAILSSALGSILGAPRTLEALMDDRVLPRPPAGWRQAKLGKNVPHVLSAAVALAAVGLGNLNAVAPVLTMFFLTAYGMINLVAGLEQLSGAPSYRPTIRVPWVVSLAGAAGCVWVMWLINPYAAIVAVVVEVLIYSALRRRSLNAAWGDMRYGALMSLARVTLLKLRELPVDPRNWRPNILLFAGDARKRIDLVRFAGWLNQNRGILTICHLVIGDLEELADKAGEQTRATDEFLDAEGLVAFAETEVVPEFEAGALSVCQANGIAGITSNTLMMGWSEKAERRVAQLRIVRRAARLGKSTILCRVAPRRWSKLRRLDIWWGGLQSNGDMLLLFAHLLSLNREWSGVRITVKSAASSALSFEQTQRNLTELVRRSRINAEAVVLPRPEKGTIKDLIHDESGDADLVFLGLQEVPVGEEDAYAQRLVGLVGDLQTVILVRAAGPYAGRLLEMGGDPV